MMKLHLGKVRNLTEQGAMQLELAVVISNIPSTYAVALCATEGGKIAMQ